MVSSCAGLGFSKTALAGSKSAENLAIKALYRPFPENGTGRAQPVPQKSSLLRNLIDCRCSLRVVGGGVLRLGVQAALVPHEHCVGPAAAGGGVTLAAVLAGILHISSFAPPDFTHEVCV
jgi:hypothetical protein